MYIKKLEIENFRNYEKQKIEFSKGINIFYGNNAQGKTNIIESIFFSSFGKSFRTNKEKEIIKKGEDFAKINIEYQKKDRDGKIKIILSDKKNIFINDVKIQKLSEMLGKINVIIFTPDDINILKQGPSNRRRFLNIMISQLKINYVNNLNYYIKTLEQRNNYLKQKNCDNNMLEIWDEKLIEYGVKIQEYRSNSIKKINEKIKPIHKEITDEEIEIKYISDFKDKKDFAEKLKKNREIDKIKGFTSVGIHRDDFKIYINGENVAVYGSQGQNRTSVISLKLAELEVIKDEIGEYPIMLLDDFMSELDNTRINKLLNKIKNLQVIITCTEKIKLDESKLFYVENGKIVTIE